MRSTLAVVHGFVENQGDLWTVTNAYLDRFVEEQRLLTGETAAESNEKIAYLRIADQIGGRLADLQAALASRDDMPEFAPEPVSEADVRRWVGSVQSRAERALNELDSRRTVLKPEDRELVDALLNQASVIKERIADLLPDNIGVLKIRHHGDLHLGQFLAVKDDVVILDFEGEPRRSLAERRSKAPAARDVAGVIRSIDYSATAALQKAMSVRTDDEARIAAALDEWRDYASTAFIDAYRHALTAHGLWPDQASRSARLLDFFLLEKAFYEIRYELSYRPHWLRVPLAGTLRILSSPETVAP
jgi:maltose alpha-D-glucosyltransferase/alpha-amylase